MFQNHHNSFPVLSNSAIRILKLRSEVTVKSVTDCNDQGIQNLYPILSFSCKDHSKGSLLACV